MPHVPNRFRHDDSLDRAARRILKILEAEEAAKQRHADGRVTAASRRGGRTGYGATERRPLTPEIPHTGLLAALGSPPTPPAKTAYLAGQVTPLAAAFSRVPPPPQGPTPYQPVAAPALALPWIIGQIPAWAPGVAAAIGLGALLSGDTRPDDEDDECAKRRDEGIGRCGQRPKMWQRGCIERAWERFVKCRRNGGRPDPSEPREWSKEDEEEWYNPNR
ncbi:MAG: hypothetical protein L0210_15540 [Rhodospirillales bacterium]|nr:hypothetical protein [Rhodospirillales bacterium]